MEEFELCKIDKNSIINKISNQKSIEFEKVESLTSKEYEEKMKKILDKKTKKTLLCSEQKEDFIVLH